MTFATLCTYLLQLAHIFARFFSFAGVTDSKAVTGSKSTLDLSSSSSGTASAVVIAAGVACGIVLTAVVVCFLVTCQKRVSSESNL